MWTRKVYPQREKIANVWEVHNIADEHTWGCPVYVLDHRFQSGSGGVPKWKPRAHIGINLGRSTVHAGNMHLVLNLCAGHVSPQLCVVFDDTFFTIPYIYIGTEPPFWSKMIETSTKLLTDKAVPTTWELPGLSSPELPLLSNQEL
eukprot:1203561-Ditylum_brightwellii.AAC.1